MRLATLMMMGIVLLWTTGVAAADLTGKWTFNGDIQGNAVVLNCDVKQSAEAKLAGPCDVSGAERVEMAGSVKEAAVTFSITVQGYTLNYTGKIEGDKVSGSIEVEGASGTFEGQRGK